MPNKDASKFYAIGAIFLIIILFFIKSLSFLINQHIFSFDTLREMFYIEQLLFLSELGKPSEFGLVLLTSLMALVTNLSPTVLVLILGNFVAFMTGIFIFIMARRLKFSKLSQIVALFIGLFSTLLLFSAENFRPEIFSFLMQVVILFLVFLSIVYEKRHYLFYSIIPFFFLFITHKTGKLVVFLLIILIVVYFLSSKNKMKDVLSLIIFAILLFLPFINSYLNFFEFYFNTGKEISPQGFNLPLENPLSFFQVFGEIFGILLLFSIIFILIIHMKIYADKKSLYLTTIAGFSLIFYSIIIILPRMGVSILPHRFYPYLFLYSIFLVSHILTYLAKKLNNKITIFLIFLLIISFFPVNFSDPLRITATPDYLESLFKIPFQEGDVIITSFTSSPALINVVANKLDYSSNYFVISGYHFWGEDKDTLVSVRKIYFSSNKVEFEKNVCNSISAEIENLNNLPSSEEFLVPPSESLKKQISVLEKPHRILIIDPKWDISLRDFDTIDDKSVDWWKYRSFIGYNSKIFLNPYLNKIYSSNEIDIYEFNGSCSSPQNEN